MNTRGRRMGKRQRTPECRFVLRAFWFVRGLNIIRTERIPVPDAAALRRAVRPYCRRAWVALYLDRDEFRTGGVWAHFAGRRAWVTHYDGLGADAHARSVRGLKGLPERIEFRIDNGQVDEVHRSLTVPREDGMRALEYFLRHGERHPKLRWAENHGDLWAPA